MRGSFAHTHPMSSAVYVAIPQDRRNGQYPSRLSISALPLFSQPSSAEREKYTNYASKLPWFCVISLPMSFPGRRRIHLDFINPRKLYAITTARFGRKRSPLLLFLSCVFVTILIKLLFFRGEKPTLVFKREDLQRIWHWEISSGHYPSRRPSMFKSDFPHFCG